jgi:hypothetical protein
MVDLLDYEPSANKLMMYILMKINIVILNKKYWTMIIFSFSFFSLALNESPHLFFYVTMSDRYSHLLLNKRPFFLEVKLHFTKNPVSYT